ncbi:MAG TPA: hypothetical protein ENN38_00200 [Actinobacteria bacterium]|nr:hypothetical protein [Actinomycetota bacterium]
MSINLLPKEIIEKRHSERRIIYFGVGTIILIFAMAVTFASLNWKIGQEENALEKIKVEQQKVNAEITKYKIYEERQAELQRRQNILNTALANEIAWDKFLNEVSMVIPGNVWLVSMNLDSGSIAYQGYTFDFPSVAKWLIRLDEIKPLKNIWLGGASKTDLEGHEVIQFDSTSHLTVTQTADSVLPEKGVAK